MVRRNRWAHSDAIGLCHECGNARSRCGQFRKGAGGDIVDRRLLSSQSVDLRNLRRVGWDDSAVHLEAGDRILLGRSGVHEASQTVLCNGGICQSKGRVCRTGNTGKQLSNGVDKGHASSAIDECQIRLSANCVCIVSNVVGKRCADHSIIASDGKGRSNCLHLCDLGRAGNGN